MARYSRAHTEANRQRIVTEAARLLRERGLDGVGVADLMAAAGLTHGGFYRHFSSKEELAAAAVQYLSAEVAQQWRTMAAEASAKGRSGLEAILQSYLSDGHKEAVGQGCAIAALGAELARLPAELRGRVAAGVEEMIDTLATELPDGTRDARKRAAEMFGALTGALVLSRIGVSSIDCSGLIETLLAHSAEQAVR